ncbi:LysR family transcriptional regulator [Leeia oryzae]|uniref:LysR family transcriptional regulator n=1 Tax=Leeia oryzae TaxID=356662 RepID=UPI000375CE54|nr:LysR family transcriptional regulator [Leeia oryzae]
MNDLRSLESFLKTVEMGSFSSAANLLGLTPAAVSKHVAKLERDLGTRLFQRSTRHLTLTEAGERLYMETSAPARQLAQALVSLTERDAQPAGTLRVSVAPGFARQYILPLLPAFLARYPSIRLDWSFENRYVDLVRENYDAAIGAGVTEDANVVARQLVPLKLLTVAAPSYLARHGQPETIEDLARHDCIRLRSATTGRLRSWDFRVGGETVTAPVDGRLILSDLDAVLDAALAGMGLARLGAHHVLPHLDAGRLVQVLPDLPSPVGAIHVYYAHTRLTPPKVRAFVDFLTEALRQTEWQERIRKLP